MDIVYNRILSVLHIIVGTGAVFGGFSAIVNPLSPFGVPTEVLKNSPFEDFLIPGLILFFVIGVGNLICFFLTVYNMNVKKLTSGAAGLTLMIWIAVQCYTLDIIAPPHIIFFIIGFIQLSMAALTNKNF